MVLKNLLRRLSSFRKGIDIDIDLNKFKAISKECIENPSDSHKILKKEFFREVREMAIKKAKEENKEDWKDMTLEIKEGEIAKQEDELWQKVKNGGHAAFALIFGISIG